MCKLKPKGENGEVTCECWETLFNSYATMTFIKWHRTKIMKHPQVKATLFCPASWDKIFLIKYFLIGKFWTRERDRQNIQTRRSVSPSRTFIAWKWKSFLNTPSTISIQGIHRLFQWRPFFLSINMGISVVLKKKLSWYYQV